MNKEITHRCMQICCNAKERERSVFDNCYVGNCRRAATGNEPQDVGHDKLLTRSHTVAQHPSRPRMFLNPLVKPEHVGTTNGPVRPSAKEGVVPPHISKAKSTRSTFNGEWIPRQTGASHRDHWASADLPTQ